MKATKIIAILITLLIEIGLIAALFIFLYKYTSGFNEPFKTFTVKYEGKLLSTEEDKLTLEPGETHRFEVGYMFDSKEESEREYQIKIIPNPKENIDFEYRLNNQLQPYSGIKDLTLGFAITQTKSSFEIYIPENWSMETMMTRLLAAKGKPDIPKIVINDSLYPFTMVITSYNQNFVYNVDFKIGEN